LKLDFDAAGWLFWITVFTLLIGPCIYLGWYIVSPDVSRWYAVGTGAVLAAISAGIISTVVNYLMQAHQKKKKLVQRKKTKKQK